MRESVQNEQLRVLVVGSGISSKGQISVEEGREGNEFKQINVKWFRRRKCQEPRLCLLWGEFRASPICISGLL